MEQPIVRLAELSDLDAAVPLFDAQLSEHDITTPVRELYHVARAVISHASLGFVLLAMAGRSVVGFAYVAAHMSLEHGGTIGWLEELYVMPEKRGRGIGSRLLAATIDRARDSHWRTMEVEVVAAHERVVPLYARHDFKLLSRKRYSRSLGT